MKNKNENVLQKIVEEACRLRALSEKAESEFLSYLYSVETDHMDIIKSCGMETFDRFLRNYELCRPERYRDFVAGIKKIGIDNAQEIGADATAVAGRRLHKSAAPQYVESLKRWREQKGGVFPTTQTAERHQQNVDPIKRVPVSIVRDHAKKNLELENLELKKEIKELKRNLKQVTQERDKLQALLNKQTAA